jgi:spermidine/putrescine ABC transporter ATP-binding subunit
MRPEAKGESGAAAVRVAGVTKLFGEVAAVDDVDLDIGHGEFFSLLGPSGCGKTTLLRLIGGFELPDAGTIAIGGRDLTLRPPYERPTNMIFQHLALFPHMNVFDNVAFGLRMKRNGEDEVRRMVDEALALVRMTGYAARGVDQLSGGQQQRIAIARALVNAPMVLLLDEPLGALDLNLRTQLQEELRRLHREIGGTFVFVTHDQGEALAMSNRIAVMDAGRIVQVASPEELYRRPRNRFVAEFVGRSNILAARVVERRPGGDHLLEIGGLAMPCRSERPLSLDSTILVALRYESLEVRPAGEADGGGRLHPAVVVDRTFLGAACRLRLALANGLELTAETAGTSAPTALAVGEAVEVGWRDDAMCPLDE